MNIWEFLDAPLFFALGLIFGPRLKRRIEAPYVWTCPEHECYLTLRSNNKDFVGQQAREHIRLFHAD